jgi:hypothetical protein
VPEIALIKRFVVWPNRFHRSLGATGLVLGEWLP